MAVIILLVMIVIQTLRNSDGITLDGALKPVTQEKLVIFDQYELETSSLYRMGQKQPDHF